MEIATLATTDGHLPPRAYGLVIEWASLHEDELRDAWNHIRRHRADDFANNIKIQNALTIGFIPDIPLQRITKIGNASLNGSIMMLANAVKRATIETLTKTINRLELETNPNFLDHFVVGCQFNR